MFTAEELMKIAEKHKKVRVFPYMLKTKYGKSLGEEYIPNPNYKPSDPRTLNTGLNNYRPPVR